MKSTCYNLIFILVTLTSCSNASQPNELIPANETFKFQSKQVGEERTINIWTPANYKTNIDPLPVIYVADSGIKEDFPHISNALIKLVKEKKIKSLISVEIKNTQRRRDLTGFTELEKDKEIAPIVGSSEKFIAFIKDELFIEIEKRYQTTSEKSILGESLSGLFVTETFLLTPEMFDSYMALDPSLWWNMQYLVRIVKEHLAKFPSPEKRIWLAGSNVGDVAPSTKESADILKAYNRANLQWRFSDEPKEKHTTTFIATKEKAII